ncbi:MAG: hypothetical protein KC621_29240 [Myxococcales bacterium]|nr:hypothetical protein [Myxococcales bacterium]
MPAPDPRPSERPWLLRILVANPWQKVVSVLLAAAIWLYVQGEEVQEVRIATQIAWNLPADLLPDEPLPTSASLTVSGPRSAIRRARKSSLRVEIDLSEQSTGDHEVDLASSANVVLPPQIRLVAIAPSAVRVSLDEVAISRAEIEPTTVGEPAEGWEVSALTLDPRVVELRGARAVMSGLRDVVTRPIDLSGLAVSTTRPVTLDLPRGVTLATNTVVSARIEVVSRVEERRFEDVPVYVWGDPSWRVSPPRISVLLQGPAVAVRSMGSEEVAAFVHLPDPPERDRYEAWLAEGAAVRVQVMHPGRDGVKVLSITPPSIVAERP